MRPTHRPGWYPATAVAPDRTGGDAAGAARSTGPVGLHVPAGTPLPPGTSFGRPEAGTDGREGAAPDGSDALPGRWGGPPRRPLLPVPLPRRAIRIAAVTAAAMLVTGTAGVAQGATPSPAWPRGVDVASWQHPGGGPIDWAAARASGLSFAIIKATEGTNYINPYFIADRAAAAQAGLVVGAYHYARPAQPISTAVDQARHFIVATGLTQIGGHLAPILDLEDTGGLDPVALSAWTRAFLEEIETETGRTPIIYTYRSFWTGKMADTHDFAKYPFWFAIYNDQANPGVLPGGWPNWALWQYTSGGTVPGIAGSVDMNVLCCTPAALTAQGDGTRSEIGKWYATAGLMRLALGAPVGGEGPAGGGGRWQPYANGLAFWSVATGVRALHGPIATKYLALGGTNGILRRPVSDVEYASAPGAQQARFQGGWIFWHPAVGVHEVNGRILQTYLALGGSASSLGLPTTDEYSVPGGRESAFQSGRLHWDAATNAVTTLPAAPPPAP